MVAASEVAKYAPNAPSAKPTLLGERLSNGRRGETVVVLPIGEMRLELLGARESQEVEAAVYRNLAALGIDHNSVTAERFELERAVLTLARSARDPADKAQAFGSESEWQQIDARVIGAAWAMYESVREALDPHQEGLTDDDRALIEMALKKKEPRLLMLCGPAKLSAYLLSMADLLSTSPPPSSPSSEPSSES